MQQRAVSPLTCLITHGKRELNAVFPNQKALVPNGFMLGLRQDTEKGDEHWDGWTETISKPLG